MPTFGGTDAGRVVKTSGLPSEFGHSADWKAPNPNGIASQSPASAPRATLGLCARIIPTLNGLHPFRTLYPFPLCQQNNVINPRKCLQIKDYVYVRHIRHQSHETGSNGMK
jgi:hypothetical protein